MREGVFSSTLGKKGIKVKRIKKRKKGSRVPRDRVKEV
jgi:hypothetical protein